VTLKVIDSEGLRGFVDVECLQNELSEVTGMTSNEMDVAAHQLMTSQTAGARDANDSSPDSTNEPWHVTYPRRIGDVYEYEFTV